MQAYSPHNLRRVTLLMRWIGNIISAKGAENDEIHLRTAEMAQIRVGSTRLSQATCSSPASPGPTYRADAGAGISVAGGGRPPDPDRRRAQVERDRGRNSRQGSSAVRDRAPSRNGGGCVAVRRPRCRGRGGDDARRHAEVQGRAYPRPAVRLARIALPDRAKRHEKNHRWRMARRKIRTNAGRLRSLWPRARPLSSACRRTGRL